MGESTRNITVLQILASLCTSWLSAQGYSEWLAREAHDSVKAKSFHPPPLLQLLQQSINVRVREICKLAERIRTCKNSLPNVFANLFGE